MYYPKSRVIENKYTAEPIFMFANTKQNYTGYYHITADGKVYSGKNGNDGQPRLLIKNSNYSPEYTGFGDSFYSNTTYDAIRESKNIQAPKITLKEPQAVQPKGRYPFYMRYFVKKVNNKMFVEIDEKQYTAFMSKDLNYNWASYIPFSTVWITSNPKADTINREMTALIEKRYNVLGFFKYMYPKS